MKINIERIQQEKEEKFKEQYSAMVLLATGLVMLDNHISQQRALRMLKEIDNKVIELSQYMTTNTCIYKGQEQIDYDMNDETLKRLHEQVGLKYNKKLFGRW